MTVGGGPSRRRRGHEQNANERRGHERWGRNAETVAAWWLRLRGFRILHRRFRTPAGEIDILARRGMLVVAVEVKARADAARAAEAVGPRQRQRIARAAEHYLARRPDAPRLGLRFDIVVVSPWRLPVHVPDAWRP